MTNFETFLINCKKLLHYDFEDEHARIISVSCELNYLEAEKLKVLISKYFNDFIIINTCGAHKETIGLSKILVDKTLKEFPNFFIFIEGCISQQFTHLASDRVIVIDNKNKFNENFYLSLTNSRHLVPKKEKYTGIIKIQEGCNSNCAYCIIPKYRGKSKSETYESIKNEIQNNIDNDVKKINLVGTNLAQYKEPVHGFGFVQLIKRIIKDFPIVRLNFDSIDPAYVDIFELIDFMKSEPRMEKNLYLATQSGSNKILKSMRRCHTKERLLEIIERAKGLNIEHDIIVGYNGENEEDFNETFNIVRLTQNGEDSSAISTYTNHFKKTDEDLPEELKKYRKKICEDCQEKIMKLINDQDKVIEYKTLAEAKNIDKDILAYNVVKFVNCDLNNDSLSVFQIIKNEMDKDNIKKVLITTNLKEDKTDLLSEIIKLLLHKKPLYQQIVLNIKYDSSIKWLTYFYKLREMFPDIELQVNILFTQFFNNINIIKDLLDNNININITPIFDYSIITKQEFVDFISSLIVIKNGYKIINKMLQDNQDSAWYIYKDHPNQDAKKDLKRLIEIL